MVLETSSGASPAAPGHAPAPPVMVVEDDASLRTLLSYYLSKEGYPVEVAEDGAAALRALERRRSQGDLPSVILLDLMLPQMNGHRVLHHLETDRIEVPVVVMSVYNHLLVAATATGADGVLIKPFDLEQVFPVVARYCEQRDQQAASR